MVIDVRIKSDVFEDDEDIICYLRNRNCIDSVTPLPRVSEDRLTQIISSYLLGRIDFSGIDAEKLKEHATSISQRINGEKEESICTCNFITIQCEDYNLRSKAHDENKPCPFCHRKIVTIGDLKSKPALQLPPLLETDCAVFYKVRDKVNQIITYLQQKDNKSEH